MTDVERLPMEDYWQRREFEERTQKIQNDVFIIKMGIYAIIIMLLILTTYVSIRLGGPLF